jgi:hypothetical protein
MWIDNDAFQAVSVIVLETLQCYDRGRSSQLILSNATKAIRQSLDKHPRVKNQMQ